VSLEMKKLISVCAVGAVAVGMVVVPGALGVKGPKQVGGAVTVSATPTTITSTTSTVTASGNVGANSGCRKDRTVRFSYVNGTTGAVTPLAATAITGPNGDYTVSLPKPTDTNPPTTSVSVQATVDAAVRRVGSKKKGQKTKKGRVFNCGQVTGQSGPLAIAPATTP
jgi:hypothetical protein